jgi:hypothetical protein
MLHKLVVIWMRILLTFLLALTWLLANLKTSFSIAFGNNFKCNFVIWGCLEFWVESISYMQPLLGVGGVNAK